MPFGGSSSRRALTRISLACAAIGALAIAPLRESTRAAARDSSGAGAASAPREVAAHVVWTRAEFVYLDADSGLLRPGMTLTFMKGSRASASALVDRELDARTTRARLEGGSLAGEKNLAKLRVLATEPPVPRPPALRVGLPSRQRVNLLFACAGLRLEPRFAGVTHHVDTLAPNLLRLTRPGGSAGGAAPDTLLVRFFAEVADQEIALERGELDLAVFWPGEGSPRLRADPRFRGAPLGLRARGVLAVVSAPRETKVPDPEALAALDREVFGGDLLAWDRLEPPLPATGSVVVAGFTADPALPGARVMDRVLGRFGTARARSALKLVYLDVPVAAADAVSVDWRKPGVRPVFALRCPLLVREGARAALAGLGGPDGVVNLVRCDANAP